MLDCTNLIHHDSLIPPEKMLACHSPSLQGQSLYNFLSNMDDVEYRILQAEDRQCQRNIYSMTMAERFVSVLGSTIYGGTVGLCTGVMSLNPVVGYSSGTVASVTSLGLFSNLGVSHHQREACSKVSLDRAERLTEKVSNIKSK